MKADNCTNYIPNPVNFRDFIRLVGLLASVSREDNLWHLRLGGVNTDFKGVIPYKNTEIPGKPGKAGKSGKGEKEEKAVAVVKVDEEKARSIMDIANGMNIMHDFIGGEGDRVRRGGVGQLDLLIVQNSSFSIRVLDRDVARIVQSVEAFQQVTSLRVTQHHFSLFSSCSSSCVILVLFTFHFILVIYCYLLFFIVLYCSLFLFIVIYCYSHFSFPPPLNSLHPVTI